MIVQIVLLLTIQALAAKNEVIAIIGTNDIHGAALPTNITIHKNNKTIEYKYGGLVYMARMIEIIKKENPGKVLYLDAGDQFQGGIESGTLISQGKIMNDFFGLAQVNGSAIGNHEFDFGPSFLFPFMKAKDGPNLAANLRSELGKQEFLPGQKNSAMFSFANGIKVGVIGLSTIETPETTAGFSSGLFPKYRF